MNKAIFLDRDGTINVEKHYLYKKEDFEFLPGVIDALKKLQVSGFILIIVTNQSGIARNYFTLTKLKQINSKLMSMLKKLNVKIV